MPPLSPDHPAPILDGLVWEEFTAKLLNEEYLTELAREYIPAITGEGAADLETERRTLETQLTTNRDAQKRLVRQMAEQDAFGTMDDVLVELQEEASAISSQLAELDHRQALAAHRESIPDQVSELVARAKQRLTNPTVELMSEVFFQSQLHLTRLSGDRFEGTASIPVFDDGGGGEVSVGAPRPLTSCTLEGLGFRSPTEMNEETT